MRILTLFFKYARLAGFPLALGMTGTLVNGTLNRVLIVELELSNLLVGLLLTGSYFFLVPFRVWIGHRSDGFGLGGRRREPYIIIGALVAGAGIIGAAWLALTSPTLSPVIIAAMLGAFTVYGLGKHASSNMFEALQADMFEGDARPRAVTLLKVALFVGAIGTGIGLGSVLNAFDPGLLMTVVIVLVGTSTLLSVIAPIGQEPRARRAEFTEASARARQTTFWQTMRTVILPDPRVRVFFLLVSLTIFGTLAQEIFLEPYGGFVLGMDIGQTARLQSIWGTGVALSMIGSGLWWIRRAGYMRVLRVGIVVALLAFGGLILAGFMGSTGLFMGAVFLIGLGTGFATAGLLTAVIEFTTTVRAGLLMGIWGVAHESGEVLGSVGGGLLVDVGNRLTDNNYLLAYGALFLLEALALVAALYLTTRVDVSAARARLQALDGEAAGLKDMPRTPEEPVIPAPLEGAPIGD